LLLVDAAMAGRVPSAAQAFGGFISLQPIFGEPSAHGEPAPGILIVAQVLGRQPIISS
jgi:hypothetical protein